MASVSNVPYVTWNEMPVCTCTMIIQKNAVLSLKKLDIDRL
jgi:hypothetical protein